MNTPSPTPTDLSRIDAGRLRIAWSDGAVSEYLAADLRDACPCASCREKRKAPPAPPSQLTVLAPGEAAPATVAGMTPVGAYAYRIEFGDGHNTGLFSLELLRKLGEATSDARE